MGRQQQSCPVIVLLTFCLDSLSSNPIIQAVGRPPGECRNELLLAANFRGLGLPTAESTVEHFPRTQAVRAHNLPLSWQKHTGSRIAPKTLNSWASMWTIQVEPERETAQCLAMLCHVSHPRSGQYYACDSKACSRQDAEACWGWWQCSRIAPGGDPWPPTYSLWAACFCGWEHCHPEQGKVWYGAQDG